MRCAVIALALPVLLAGAGCSTTHTLDAPYSQVVRAVQVAYGGTESEFRLSKSETSPGRECKFSLDSPMDEAGFMRSSGQTVVTVKAAGAGKTKVSVRALRDNFVTVDRDERREAQVLKTIEQVLPAATDAPRQPSRRASPRSPMDDDTNTLPPPSKNPHGKPSDFDPWAE